MFLVSSEQTGDAFCVLRFFIPPGNVTLPHLHRATDETFLTESGEIEINRGGELLRGRVSKLEEKELRLCKRLIRRALHMGQQLCMNLQRATVDPKSVKELAIM